MQNENLSPLQAFLRNKWTLLVFAADIIVIIFIIVFFINKNAETALVDFNIAPVDVVITVNGVGGYRNSGQALDGNQNSGQTYSFIPGTYEIQISHPDLDTKTFTLNLESDTNTTITTFLSKDGDFNYYALRDNFGDFDRLASIASAENNRTIDRDTSAEWFISNFQKDYELYSTALPVTYSEYENNRLEKYISVRAGNNCALTLCLETTIYSEADKTLVDNILVDAGFNLEDFEIEYNIY